MVFPSGLRRSCDNGSSSSTDTSCPCSIAHFATADPTRPAPTMSMNMGRTLAASAREHPQQRRALSGRHAPGVAAAGA